MLNKKIVTKSSISVKKEDSVSLDHKITVQITVVPPKLKVIYEDNDCVVIEKPVGVLTHSKGAYNAEGTVASWLVTREGFDFVDASDRSGIVHRLDRATSGVMICAKNKRALGHLQKQFQTRKAKKTYRSRVDGHLKHPRAILDLPIERNPKTPQKFRVGQNGKSAVTEYKVIKQLGKYDYIELYPTTGRTHQLRVHMKYLGHPVVGDTFYDGPKAGRLYLHAYSLEITLPTSERQTFVSKVPLAFTKEVI